MDFYSAYAQGFARVAACTIPVAIADPAANARTVLEQHIAVPSPPPAATTSNGRKRAPRTERAPAAKRGRA